MQTPGKLVVAMRIRAAPIVRMKRSMIDTNETQPPLISSGPSRSRVSWSSRGLKIPISKAKGATSSSFFAR